MILGIVKPDNESIKYISVSSFEVNLLNASYNFSLLEIENVDNLVFFCAKAWDILHDNRTIIFIYGGEIDGWLEHKKILLNRYHNPNEL